VSDVVQQVGDVMLLVAAMVATASVVVHAGVSPPWWRTGLGRHLFWYMASIASNLDLGAARVVVGASLDTPWFVAVRLAVFASVLVVLSWRLLIQIRLRIGAYERTREG
jgi:hypothetical protein